MSGRRPNRRQGCQIFLVITYQNGKNIPQNILVNGHNMYEMAVHKIEQLDKIFFNFFSMQDTPKFTQIGISGLKICHLATLIAAA
jgi:hypothetical protein